MRKPKTSMRAAANVAAAVAATFLLWVPAHAYTETVLHSFAGGSDGDLPDGNLIMDQNGNLFGTTVYGGGACTYKRGCGTVFELAPDGTETVLHAFARGSDGANPYGGLVEDKNGNLYGTTSEFGHRSGSNCCGTIFEVTQQGVHTILYAFRRRDGSAPFAGLLIDQTTGNFYGTTSLGGAAGYGTAFELSQGGAFTLLYSFQGSTDGDSPRAPLVADSAGNFYGTTEQGGNSSGCGTVFRFAPDHTESVLYAFRGGRDGCFPSGGLISDANGFLYGTTSTGGGGTGCNGLGCGTVFELSSDGSETILSRFKDGNGPQSPVGGLIRDKTGNLYGTSFGGGSAKCGTIFKFPFARKAKVLYSFSCGNDGAFPGAGLLMDQSGNLYGTTRDGGAEGDGVVFELKK